MNKSIARKLLSVAIAVVATAGMANGQTESGKAKSAPYPGHDYGVSPTKAMGLWNLPATNGGGSSYYDSVRPDVRVASAKPIATTPAKDPNISVAPSEVERVDRVAQALIQNGGTESINPLQMLPLPPNSPTALGPIGLDVPPIQTSAPQVNPHYPQGDVVIGGVGPIGPQEVPMPSAGCDSCNLGGIGAGYQPAGVPGSFGSRPRPPAKTGFFFHWDRLFTFLDNSTGPVGTPRLTQAAPAGGLPGFIVNGVDNDIFNQRPDFTGDRLEFGFCDGVGGTGWLGSVLFFDQQKNAALAGATILFNDPTNLLLGFADADGDGFDDDLNGDNIFGRDGQDTDFDGIPDVPAAQDDADQTTMFPQFNALNASLRTEVNGFELSRIGYAPGGRRIARANSGRNLLFGSGAGIGGAGAGCSDRGCSGGGCSGSGCSGSGTTGVACGGRGAIGGGGLRMLYGLRYLEVSEQYGLAGTGGFMDVNINSDVENFLFGPQIGLLYGGSTGALAYDASVRFMPGVNFLRANQTTTITGVSNGGQNEPLNALPAVNFNGISTTEQFASVVEWRYGLNYCLTRFLSVRAGYTGWWVGGLTRGANAYNFDLSNPNVTLSDDDDLFAHALTFGLEFAY